MREGEAYREDLVKKKLANELKPEYIKKTINKVDNAYSQLLTANMNV